MKTRFKIFIWTVLIAALLLAVPTAMALDNWQEPGNSDLNILNGGVMLTSGEDFYFTNGGIFLQREDTVTALSADDGRNLNLVGDMLYYSLGNEVRRIPLNGGESETVHTAPGIIKQLYVIGDELLYLADGRVYLGELFGKPVSVSELSGVMGLIPTKYGNLMLTGQVRNYTLWAEDKVILENVQSCYTDSGYLAVQIDNVNYMAELSSLFKGFTRSQLLDFSIHGTVSLMEILDPDQINTISEDNENNELMLDFNALLIEAGFEPKASLFTEQESGESVIPTVSQGQKNMVLRARQLHEIEWTPLEDITQWGYRGTFKAETNYTGIPYGQPVNTNGYVGYGVSIENFAAAVRDNTSRFYSEYSTYNKIAPVYSTDCSGYVSYAWGLKPRYTTYSLPQIAEKVGDQSLYSIQVGDCLDKTTSHVVLVSDLSYDSEGNIVGIEIMEQTPVITKLTRYGAGESRSLASFQSYYLNGGYGIYRYPERESVAYTPNAAVVLDGEYVDGVKDKAPKTKTTAIVGGKTVALTSDNPNAVIYYTTDGSTPTTASMVYTGPMTFYDTVTLKAIAYTGLYSGSDVLTYRVKVVQLDPPSFSVTSGLSAGNYVSSGAKVTISSVSGAKILYTTDGSDPKVNGKVYSGPITLNQATVIKACATALGYKDSGVSTASYSIGKVYTINASSGSGGSISPSGAVSVLETGSYTFKFSPNRGYKVKNVQVDGANLGEISEYTFTNISSGHSISVSFVPNVTLPFTDVKESQWFYESVCYVYGNDLYKGMSDTLFGPDVHMTRGMFVTVLGRLAGVSESLAGTQVGVTTGTDINIRKGPSTDTEKVGIVNRKYTAMTVLGKENNWYNVKYGSVTGYIRDDLFKAYNNEFSDLNTNSYYSHFAQWASLTGISSGAASGTFRGEEQITREDMCLMLYNYASVYGKTLPIIKEKTTFSDDAYFGSVTKSAVYALQRAGVIDGMGDGSFNPKGSATRAHVAQIFRKYSEIM